MEKEKQQLIYRFENAFKKKNQIDPEIVKELFPEDENLYNKIKKMTDKMNRTDYGTHNNSKVEDNKKSVEKNNKNKFNE